MIVFLIDIIDKTFLRFFYTMVSNYYIEPSLTRGCSYIILSIYFCQYYNTPSQWINYDKPAWLIFFKAIKNLTFYIMILNIDGIIVIYYLNKLINLY